jgi:pantoate--beta-alanine ligase
VIVARTIAEARAALNRLSPDHRVGLVPTMGALHEGHLSLLRAARAENELVVMSLFVNPAQFDEPADLACYPRDEARDLRLAENAGVDVVFAPSPEEMYPPGFGTWVEVDEGGAEGAARPGHFRGVATVVLKLISLFDPKRAYFGQKDGRQAALVFKLVRDLALRVEVRVLPTVRDTDGLAISSRNVHLSPEEREVALHLPRALEAARTATHPVTAVRAALGLGGAAAAQAQPGRDGPALPGHPGSTNGLTPEYVEIVELDGARLLAAAIRVGSTRLIDNVLLEGELP